MLAANQYGVSVPGGVDTLVHARRCFREAVCADPSLGVWCELDVDMVNAFPSLTWRAVDVAMRDQLPDLARWSEWCHKEAAIHLPSGNVHAANRGAEQGDPDGSVQCGAVLAGVRQRTCAAFASAALAEDAAATPSILAHPVPLNVFDLWYADDG